MSTIETSKRTCFSYEETRVYRDGFRTQVEGWYFNYRGVAAFHGPYGTEAEAKSAGEVYLAAAIKSNNDAYERTTGVPWSVAQARMADRIDGYDRDDLGESPDY